MIFFDTVDFAIASFLEVNPNPEVNRDHPETPLNLANNYNSNVPFAPLDGGSGRQKMWYHTPVDS
jgi:hypothetical protein